MVNTCSFIGDARPESVRTLVELADQGKQLIVAGRAWLSIFKEELLAEIPEARAIVGTGDIEKIVEVYKAVSSDSSLRVVEVSDVPNDYTDEVLPRMMTGVGASAYLKIAEGCDHRCTFCIIPILRGRLPLTHHRVARKRSKSPRQYRCARNHSGICKTPLIMVSIFTSAKLCRSFLKHCMKSKSWTGSASCTAIQLRLPMNS